MRLLISITQLLSLLSAGSRLLELDIENFRWLLLTKDAKDC